MSQTINARTARFTATNGQDHITINNTEAHAGDLCQITPINDSSSAGLRVTGVTVSEGSIALTFSALAANQYLMFNLITP